MCIPEWLCNEILTCNKPELVAAGLLSVSETILITYDSGSKPNKIVGCAGSTIVGERILFGWITIELRKH